MNKKTVYLKNIDILQGNYCTTFGVFQNYKIVKRRFIGVNKGIYEVVYSIGLPESIDAHLSMDIDHVDDLLEYIYYVFNQKIPQDFHGHSLSISDIVSLEFKDINTENTFKVDYMVDISGFREVVYLKEG